MSANPTTQKMLPAYSPAVERAKPTGRKLPEHRSTTICVSSASFVSSPAPSARSNPTAIRARLTTCSMPLIHFAAARPTIIRLASGRPSPVPREHAANQALRAAPPIPPPTNASHHPRSSASGRHRPRAAWRTGTKSRTIPQDPLDPVRPLGTEHINGRRERIALHVFAHQHSEPLHSLAEVDWLGCHHHPDSSGRADHRLTFGAWTMAAIIVKLAYPMCRENGGAERRLPNTWMRWFSRSAT